MYHTNEDSFQIITLLVTQKFVDDAIHKKLPTSQIEFEMKDTIQKIRKKLNAKQNNKPPSNLDPTQIKLK